jgi:hypothetical protein
MTDHSRSPYLCGAVAALFALACAPSHARDDGAQGMVVVRDAATGLLRAPTPAELRALRAGDPALAAPHTHQPSTTRPDGTRQLRLSEGSVVYSVASRDSAGHLAIDCVQGAAAADAATSHAAPAAAAAAPATAPSKESHHDAD